MKNLKINSDFAFDLYVAVTVDIKHGDVDRLFHYGVMGDVATNIQVGQRVRVPFGKGNKLILGYVIEIYKAKKVATPSLCDGNCDSNFLAEKQELPEGIPMEKLKAVDSIMDGFSVLTPDTLKLALWMKDKYYTTLISTIHCIVPTAKPDGRFPMSRKKPLKISPTPSSITLTKEQAIAIEQIKDITNNTPILLHGVTGSGKTEVYLHAIEHVLHQGLQAIVLVPEIALTPQIVGLFTARFGSNVAVTHSRLTSGERFQIWKQALDGEINLVIGPRSAVFAPLSRIGLIVIDEEHEHSYHSETTPKYDAREVAIKRAQISGTGTKVVLGSATPSLNSYFHTQDEYKQEITNPQPYLLAELKERVNKTMPDVTVLDMRQELIRGNPSIFAAQFQMELADTIKAGQQAILFLNRRGHSSFVSCRQCGYVMECNDCRVNYTFHVTHNRLLCHYCGKGITMPTVCPGCSSEHIRRFGAGTQKVEEEVAKLFPGVGVLRMDMDTTKGKHGHAKILEAFRNGEAQILIGTQMVAKGLDFPRVTLVGVVAADISLYSGDFRAGEYTFQLLTQVAGRAGRAMHEGKVFLQTYNPDHYAIIFSQQANYSEFYLHEMAIRRAMIYPPFSHVFSIMFTGESEKPVIEALQKLSAIMDYTNKRDSKTHNGIERFQTIGISPAFVSRIKKQYRWKLLVKCKEEEPLKSFVIYCMRKLRENDPLTGLTTHLTLNPVNME